MTQKLRDQSDTQCDPEFAGNRNQADIQWLEQLVYLRTVVAMTRFLKELWCARYDENSTIRTNSAC